MEEEEEKYPSWPYPAKSAKKKEFLISDAVPTSWRGGVVVAHDAVRGANMMRADQHAHALACFD